MKRIALPTAVIACLVAAVVQPLPATAGEEAPPFVYLPPTISPEAAAILRGMPGPGGARTLPEADDVEAWAAAQQAAETRTLKRQKSRLERLEPDIAEVELGGVPVLDIRPRGWQDNGKLLVYTHGGAYTFQSARSTAGIAARMADITGLRVISIDYTLAPQARWQQVTDEVVAVFRALKTMGYTMGDIAIIGDSAGGSLAGGATLKMRDLGLGMPAAVVMWSPWSDITDVGDTYTTLRDVEPFYTYDEILGKAADAYADAADQKHPYVSPVYGDYRQGFPPTLIQGGTKEIFLSNFVRQYQAIDSAGQSAILDLYEGMVHVFQVSVPGSPEAELAWSKSAEFLKTHLVGDE